MRAEDPVEKIHACSTSGVQRCGGARGDCLIGYPLPKPNIEQWRMVVIVAGYTLFVTSQYDIIFRFATNVLAKFVDATCVFRDAWAAVGSGVQRGGERGAGPWHPRQGGIQRVKSQKI